MKPVIALVGRPNVGKSTLFNKLTKSRDAIVADFPGLTRDRQYGSGKLGGWPYIVIDTGGLLDEENTLYSSMATQTWLAVEEADVVLFMVDGREGMAGADQEIAEQLRRRNKHTTLVINKCDGIDIDTASSEFFGLGFEHVEQISASQSRGFMSMLDTLKSRFDGVDLIDLPPDPDVISVAVVGRPNVGKSTLVNRILGEERVVASPEAGTTRDAIDIAFQRDEIDYLFIDTAGVRRKGKVSGAVEKFSVVKTLQAIERCQIVLQLIDAGESLTDQDMHLLGFCLDQGKALIFAVNKWDHLSPEHRDQVKSDLQRRLVFLDFTTPRFISALHGTGVGELFKIIGEAHRSAMTEMATPKLTRILEDAIQQHAPPMVRGRRPKLRYAHQGGKNPPRIIIHGSNTDSIPTSYRRFLEHTFRRVLKLRHTPLKVEFKTGDNPYEGKRNTLTPRQLHKKKRNLDFFKKKAR